MKEREMKIAKEVIEKGEGKHMYTGEQLLFRLSIQIPNENIKELVDNPRFTVENFNNTGEIEVND